MIKDNLKYADIYKQLGPRFAQAIEYARSTDLSKLSVGRHEIDGANLYLIIRSYTTEKAFERKYEIHRKYMDLQLMLEGQEIIYCADAEGMEPVTEYDAKEDILFLKEDAGTAVLVSAGEFLIAYPHDAHKPQCAAGVPKLVRKAVFKFLV
jgi:biofilm protein TabA